MSTLSTHVLDAALGVPAAGLEASLANADGTPLETATTDADGRIVAGLLDGRHRHRVGRADRALGNLAAAEAGDGECRHRRLPGIAIGEVTTDDRIHAGFPQMPRGHSARPVAARPIIGAAVGNLGAMPHKARSRHAHLGVLSHRPRERAR